MRGGWKSSREKCQTHKQKSGQNVITPEQMQPRCHWDVTSISSVLSAQLLLSHQLFLLWGVASSPRAFSPHSTHSFPTRRDTLWHWSLYFSFSVLLPKSSTAPGTWWCAKNRLNKWMNEWMNELVDLSHWVNVKSHYFQPHRHKKILHSGLCLVFRDLENFSLAMDEGRFVYLIEFPRSWNPFSSRHTNHLHQPLHFAHGTTEAQLRATEEGC